MVSPNPARGAIASRDRLSRRRIFLASDGLSALPRLLGDTTAGLRVAFVPTPAGEDADTQPWVQTDRKQLTMLGCRLTTLELATAEPDDVAAALRAVDGVFVTGGNAYLVLWHARRSGFAELVPPLVTTGALLYMGTSAGAMLAGPEIEPGANPAGRLAAPSLQSTAALQLVRFTVLPHDQEAERHAMNEAIVARHGPANFVVLCDDQAVLVRGDSYSIVDSPPLES
jgi:dipeptidase E